MFLAHFLSDTRGWLVSIQLSDSPATSKGQDEDRIPCRVLDAHDCDPRDEDSHCHRAKGILEDRTDLQTLVNAFHIGYFVCIAVIETWSAFFLIRIFAEARRSSMVVFSKTGIFRELTRSAETRLATLCLIGLMRAVTYSFQATAQSATSVAGQLDRFAYTLECMFPVVMM